MKSRSHRITSSDPPDDWVDGSWTVDCVCGVNFDDGEEMVNCDECGVWVHTRCSRYVKGEKLFACDKCKSKNSRNDSEETEVAQLLVELPTKTMRMESSYHLSNPPPGRPFRLWTDIPIEERVHVQGIPGGDPALFGGLSSVFTPELWKCTGYVPKKFNFQYREFPCWDEKQEVDAKIEEENENTVDKGAGALFSLSNDTVLATPAATLAGMRGRVQDGGSDRKLHSKEMKKWEGDDLDARRVQNGIKKERNLFRPLVIHSGKRKKEDLGMSKDRSGKKKARGVDKEADTKKRSAHSSKTVVFTPSSDAKQLEFHEDRGPKFLKTDSPNIKNGNLRDTVPQVPVSDGNLIVEKYVDKPENILAANEHPSETFSSDMSRHNYSIEAGLKEEKTGHEVISEVKSSPKTDVVAASLVGNSDVGNLTIKEEGVSMAVCNLDDNGGSFSACVVIDSHRLKPSVDDMASAVPEVKDNQILQDSNDDMSRSSVQPNVKVEIEGDDDNAKADLNFQSSSLDDVKVDGTKHLAQHPGISADHISENSKVNYDENSKVNDAVVSSSQSSDHKVQDVERSSEAVSDCHAHKTDDLSGDQCQRKRELETSEGSMVVEKNSSEPKNSSKQAEEQSKSVGTSQSPPALPSQRKMVVCVGKSSSSSSTIVISKSSVSDNSKSADTPNPDPITKQRATPNCNISIKKDHFASEVVRDEDGREMPRKTIKERPKSSANSTLKASHSSRSSQASAFKQNFSDSKDYVAYSSSKASSVQNSAVTSGSGESAGSLKSQHALHAQDKITSSSLLQRGEKFNQSNGQSSSKINHTAAMHPPAPSNSSATLSDEELALLLHQELNSSPRVPRVPRMRQAGSLPQLASPTATSMLIKRTSSFGLKDHSSVSRRKNKDVSKDGSRSSHELDDEAKKMDRVASSPDQRRQDSIYTAADVSTSKEADDGSPKAVNSVKKSIPPASSMTANSGPSSSAEANCQNSSSIRNSPRNVSDDDTGIVGAPVHRTLPGLLDEIMSKGRRMTYEELCNAVLPHWRNLRKHNGERYAYSSHSQAVLDCLRNRSEWAQLVDRGPKTNASRKRRKLDAEPPSFESEDNNKNGKGRSAKEVEGKSLESHREEFPKGKRKARKRRRLALQGRGIKDVRKRRKADVLSDDDIDLFSDSSEESIFTEDEIRGGGTCPVGSEASASSDETGTML
ncbi:hypothetical protein L1049_021881 [Liquidambar formosana]|uniref:Zinc finger PHD-type domain-containing protein n=1 Tax=Liquidambar formosana TaxID=63359 RepID=A0AAP0WQA1_LIQFO